MTTYFISDLHLCDQQPLITKLFVQFCRDQANDAKTLYILGDLFEYWLGDDAIKQTGNKTADVVKTELSSLSKQGTDIYFMAGNRDFLLGEEFANQCGMQILQEPSVIDLYGEPILLIHGDAECTEDKPYQQARTLMRNPQWQQQFLSMDIEQRIQFAENARQQSQEHTSEASVEIMDVNQTAIDDLFAEHAVKTMIHGHTHRPAVHKSDQTIRIVLGDWHHQSSYLVANEGSMKLISA